MTIFGGYMMMARPPVAAGFSYDFTTFDQSEANAVVGGTLPVGTTFNSSGTLVTSTSGDPRLQHTAAGARQGLLIEPEFTNKCLRSSAFGTGPWAGSSQGSGQVPVSNGTVTGPDGVSDSAQRWTFRPTGTGGGDRSFLQQTISSHPASTSATFTIWARVASGTQTMRFAINMASTGTGFSSGDSETTLTTSWQRITRTGTGGSSGGQITPQIYIHGSYTGGANVDIELFGAQVTNGTTVRSYVPTTSVAVTRSADDPALDALGVATLDVTVTYLDDTTTELNGETVGPTYWPSGLSDKIIKSIVGVPA
jgi:hypothetical protein